ncbi:hypothetical protein BCV71DRAFT_254960 [Rhizopus microsporus]|uniref:SWIM-type domain-containing protein n=1 Tax=Rhizopus microsporus TaxID=58291 RepID=A0A1X0S4V8_RHIZD|nr:hypothetical protein BCV71DRAFT_254960 [Rhizopus microsporus]
MECIPDMITESGTPGVYLVQLFSNIELQHEVTVIESKTKICSCNDFRYDNIACKHMYLLSLLHAGIAPFKYNLTAEMANLLAAYRSYRENPYRLIDEQITNIRLDTELMLSATDQNFSTQDATYFQFK